MATIINSIERFFRQKTILSNLIAINIIVFLILKFVNVWCTLLNLNPDIIFSFFKLPASFSDAFLHPWTLTTYMFTHFGFWHILFNLLWFYWFGSIFLQFFTSKQMGGLYLIGGLSGGLLFILSYNIFPFFSNNISGNFLIGASASVMAIVFATAFYRKEYEISMLFLGNIKIIYLAVFCLVLDLLSMTSINAGGHIAHLGGAGCGIIFSECIKKGIDITAWLNGLIDRIVNLFRKKPDLHVTYKRFETDYEYNKKKNASNEEIDRILDKIKKSGYGSLTEDEKKKMFDASK